MKHTHTHMRITPTLRLIKIWHLPFIVALALAAAMLSGPGIKLTRPVKAASTYFVRTDGSNAVCNGLSNASAASAPNCAFQTIQFAVTTAASGDTINVGAGTFNEDVTISKALIVSGSGVANTTVSGPIGGGGSTFAITASNVELKNFKITRAGNNTTDWNNAGLNTVGVSIIGTALTGMNVHDNLITQNRTGIDVNNSSGHTIRNNVITDNRTGLLFRNQTDNLTVVENEITDNWTVGVLFLDASSGTNVPVQTALNCAFFNNDISGNWYGQIVDRQTGGSLPAPGTTNLKNFSGNWFGTNTPVISVANSAEPGYSVQIPVAFGGTATPPGGQPDVLGPASANFDITPLLETGVDTNVETTLGRGVYGFQGNFNNLRILAAGAQTGGSGRIQEGINLTGAGGVINLPSGAYTEQLVISKNLTLTGAGKATTTIQAPASMVAGFNGSHPIVEINNGATVTASGFTVAGTINAPGCGFDFYGFLIVQAATLNLSNAGVIDIRASNSGLYGCQDGIGVRAGRLFWNTTGAANLDNVMITGYQKGGVVIDNTGSSGDVKNSMIAASPLVLPIIAPNGVQVGRGASAMITGNNISGNKCNHPTACGPDPLTQTFATGVLVFGVAATNVTVSGNTLTDNDVGAYSNTFGQTSNITGNLITNNRFEGVYLDAGSANVTNNTISGSNIGVVAVSFSTSYGDTGNSFPTNQNSAGAINGNHILSNIKGIQLLDDDGSDSFTPTVTACGNRIVGNTMAGLDNSSGGAATATDNWWGCNAGPGNAGCDAVTGTGNHPFNPWLVLGITASPPNPPVNTPSTLTASLKKNSNGAVASCAAPNGTPVSFAGTGGMVSPVNTTTSGGMAMSTYTAGNTPGVFSASTTVDNQTVSTAINITTAPAITCPADVTVGSDIGKNTASVPFTVTATGAPTPTVTCKVGSTAITSPYNFPVGTTTVNCTATNGTAPDATCSFKVTVNKVSAAFSDPLDCTGPGNVVTGTISITNNGNVAASAAMTTTLPTGGLLALPGTCVASVGTCAVVDASTITYSNSIPAGQTVTITYLAQVGDQVTTGTKLCATTEVSFNGGPKASASPCVTVTCPALGPGQIPNAQSPVSDQRAGSVLIYNLYTSSASSPNAQNTRISLTNIHGVLPARVHLFFVDGSNCSVADSYVCLTANQTTSFLAADLDPGTTGYIVAVAVDDKGCPVNFNYLIGDEYVKLESGHAANLGAEAFTAIAGGLPRCDDNSTQAELKFDGVSYSHAPRVLALSNIASRVDGNDTLLVLNRIGGNLATGASTLTDVFGIFYDDGENGVSFTFNPRTCQFRSSITSSFPRITPRFESFVPSGRSGWLKLYSTSDQAILGAAINFNGNAGSSSGAFNQGHNLHKLTLSSSAVYTIPVFPPSC